MIPYGPIRSGVFESIQFVIETGGEDVLALEVRPFFKHRRLEQRFAGLEPRHGVRGRRAGRRHRRRSPTRCAFCQAVERALGVEPPPAAQRWRVVHAELERIANHLDVAAKLAEDAALSVGVARFGILKEHVSGCGRALRQPLRPRRRRPPAASPEGPSFRSRELRRSLDEFERDLRRDRRLLLRNGLVHRPADRQRHARPRDGRRLRGVGPVARGCGDRRPTPASSAPTAPTPGRACGSSPPRTATRWRGSRSASTRSPRACT